MFDYMRQHNKRYAFRQPVVDENVRDGFYELVNEFLEGRKQFLESYVGISAYQSHKKLGFYNNFFIAEIDFFMSPPTSLLLDDIDKSKMIYEQRLSDLFIQSVLVRLFLQPHQILWIRDFTYEHTTLVGGLRKEMGCPSNGGISRGIGAHTDEEWRGIHDSFIGRFSHNSACLLNRLVRTKGFIGAKDVGNCENETPLCLHGGLRQFATKPMRPADLTGIVSSSLTPVANQTKESISWHSSVRGVYDGTAFHRSSSCSTIKKVSEWHICWDVVERDIMAGRCIVYSFGIAGDDPFTNYMSKAGCQVVSSFCCFGSHYIFLS